MRYPRQGLPDLISHCRKVFNVQNGSMGPSWAHVESSSTGTSIMALSLVDYFSFSRRETKGLVHCTCNVTAAEAGAQRWMKNVERTHTRLNIRLKAYEPLRVVLFGFELAVSTTAAIASDTSPGRGSFE